MRAMLVTVGTILFLPWSASAVTVDDLVGLPPVSQHYVQRTLDRVDAGLAQAAANTTMGGPVFDIFFGRWAGYAASATLSLVDTRTWVESQATDLQETTACLHLDIIILQSKIEKVRQQLHQALNNAEVGKVIFLQQIIRFLNDRILHLLRGARDPQYFDSGWGAQQPFDPPGTVWCCPARGLSGSMCLSMDLGACTATGGLAFITPHGCTARGCLMPQGEDPYGGRMCPFHSDYLALSSSGYGCDSTVLTATGVHLATQAEALALDAVLEERIKLLQLYQTSQDLLSALGGITGAIREPEPLEHRTIAGCAQDIPEAQIAGADTALFRSIGATSYSLRGPFSLEKNEPGILYRFAGVVRRWGGLRPQAEYIKQPGEFPPGPLRDAAQQRFQGKDSLRRGAEWFLRLYFRWWNFYHGRHEARPVARGQDLELQLEQTTSGDLREATGRLIALTESHASGLRGFGKKFAYFLRRSCVYRPCNRQLEQVLRILFSDRCFPYGKGWYFGDPEAYRRCKDAAQVNVEP
jgi:hypothetical protein